MIGDMNRLMPVATPEDGSVVQNAKILTGRSLIHPDCNY
jgi:hypothetical protein